MQLEALRLESVPTFVDSIWIALAAEPLDEAAAVPLPSKLVYEYKDDESALNLSNRVLPAVTVAGSKTKTKSVYVAGIEEKVTVAVLLANVCVDITS